MNKQMFIVGIIIFIIVGLSGCTTNDGDNGDGTEDGILYKEIPSAVITEECTEFKDDICGLYDCMVSGCWCNDLYYPSSVLYEPTGIIIKSEQDAIDVVEEFIEGTDLDIKEYNITKSASKQNNIFYIVFIENANGEEENLIVAVDGIILKVICGV